MFNQFKRLSSAKRCLSVDKILVEFLKEQLGEKISIKMRNFTVGLVVVGRLCKMDFVEFLEELGKGTYGLDRRQLQTALLLLCVLVCSVVNLCIKKHNKHKVVIKEIDLDKHSDHLEASQNEVGIMRTLNNPNVIKYYDSYIRNGKFYIMMEYASKGSLHEFILKSRPNLLEPQVVVNLFVQILMGLNHIHMKKIIHRDLKPQNIFLTGLKGDVVKIGDFGISKLLRLVLNFIL